MTEGDEAVELPVGDGSVPLSVLRPGKAPAAVVLMGHGLGVDREHATVRAPAGMLVDLGCAVLVPDLPLHGRRAEPDGEPDAERESIVDAWQTFWADGGYRTLSAEFSTILDFARQRFPELPVGYFGLSLGTQYGVAFLASATGIGAAVLGLFGSEPPPRSQVMNHCAPRIRCPIYFIQKQHDEIHPRATTDHLFGLIGSENKILDSTPGTHSETSPASITAACEFLVQNLMGDP